MSFKSIHEFEFRKQEAIRILHKYPERVPIIVEKSQTCNDIKKIDKIKYLVPRDITMSQFIFVIRKRLHLSPEKALFLFVKDTFISQNQLLGSVHDTYQDEDGFLYVEYSSENTFGY